MWAGAYGLGGGRRGRLDLDPDEHIYADVEGEEGHTDAVPLGKEPQLWEFARDVVTSLVSDLAVVSARKRRWDASS